MTRTVPTAMLLTGSLVLSSLLATAYAFAPPFVFFLVARVLWGLCWSFLRQIGTMTSISRADERNIGQVIGFYNGIIRLGFIAGSLLGGLFFDLFGYRWAFLLFAGVNFLGIPFAVSGLSGERNRISNFHPGPGGERLSANIMFRGFTVGCVGSGIIMSTLGLILAERLGKGVTVGGIAVGVATINGVLLASRQILSSVGSPFLGTLIDRIGVVRTQRYVFVGAAVALLLAGLFPEVVVLLLMVVFFFVCETTLRIALTVEAGKKGPRAYALLSTATDAGSAVGPILAWTVFDLLSNSPVLFLIGGSLYAVSTVFSIHSTRRTTRFGRSAPR
jgi:predicted MFS family arabinose efflux permease